MATEKKTVIYDVVLRFDHNGDLQGAHQVDLRWSLDDETGQFIPDRASDAKPLDKAALKGVLTAAMVDAANRITALRDENEALTERLEKLRASAETAAAEANRFMAQMIHEGRRLLEENRALRAEIADLRGQRPAGAEAA